MPEGVSLGLSQSLTAVSLHLGYPLARALPSSHFFPECQDDSDVNRNKIMPIRVSAHPVEPARDHQCLRPN